MLHQVLRRYGIYYAKRRYMAGGIDWLWDLGRANVGATPMVFDVGANEGQTTASVLETFPAAIVHAFEPVGHTFEVLQRNLAARRNVRCNRLAVSDSNAPVQMAVSANSQLSRAVSRGGVRSDLAVESVEGTTLDAYCERQRIGRIDVLKTDTEGHDLQVLQGAEGLFRARAVGWVLSEVTFDRTDLDHSQFTPIRAWLEERGLEVYGFYEHYHLRAEKRLLFCNALFVQRA